MATLAQLAEVELEVELTDTPAEMALATSDDLHASSPFLHLIVKMFVGTLILPFLLAMSLIVFLIALTDFAWFRLRDLRHGPSQPKGLWEF